MMRFMGPSLRRLAWSILLGAALGLLLVCLRIPNLPFASDDSASSHRQRTTSDTDSDQHQSSWCPNVTCPNSHVCKPCQRRFLIILAIGRSASTTLTWMLNSLPGVRMSGENNNQLRAIRVMIDNVRSHKDFNRGVGEKGPWGHNPVPEGAFSCAAQHIIETINPSLSQNESSYDDSDTIVGFKTIRFLVGIKSKEDLRVWVRWVREHLPCTRFVVNIRSDVEAQVASVNKTFKKKLNTRNATEYLQQANSQLRTVAQLFGKQAYLLDSSEWTKDISHLNRLVQWLGFDQTCFFEELLELNIDRYDHGRSEIRMNPLCLPI